MKLVLGIAAVCLLAAQEKPPARQKAADWPAHVEFDRAGIGAEYLTHSVLWNGHTVFLKDYLVVEVAVFPVDRQSYFLKQEDFTLRVNGRKQPLYPQPATMVAGSLRTYDQLPQGTQAGGSLSDVILGRRRPEQFPGDTPPDPNRRPAPPRAPEPEDRSGVEKDRKLTPEEVLTQAALYEGKLAEPVRGLLYFAYKAKPGAVKKVDLVYSGGGGNVVFPLL